MEVEGYTRPRRNTTLIPNMMYVSRENTTQANTHKREAKTQDLVTAKGGTVVPTCTATPCHFAGHKAVREPKEHGLGALEVGFGFALFCDV